MRLSSASSICSENSSSSLNWCVLANCDNVDWDAVEAHVLQQILGIWVDIKLSRLGVLSEVQSGDLWYVLILSLTLLFLQLEGDTSDWSTLNTLHQVSGVTCDLCQQLDVSLKG